MDKTIPPSAAIILDFIRETETGKAGIEGYNVIYGHKQGKLPKPLTTMTLDEVQKAQTGWSKSNGSSAAGGYQFMRATLKEMMAELGLRGSQHLTIELQDRLGYHLLKRRGYAAFMAGQITNVEFGKRLAQEWASFPVLSATKGATRQLSRGQSYYAGDGLNKALVTPKAVEDVLGAAMRAAAPDVALPIPEPKPIPTVIPAPVPAPIPIPPKESTMNNTAIFRDVFERVKDVLEKPSVPVANHEASTVAREVALELAPVIVNATNAEPWWNSRIYRGLIAAGIGMVTSRMGFFATDADIALLVELAGEIITAAGGLYALYGRIVGSRMKPLGTQ